MVNKSLIWPPCCQDIPAAVLPEMDLWTIFLYNQMALASVNVTDCGYGKTICWILSGILKAVENIFDLLYLACTALPGPVK